MAKDNHIIVWTEKKYDKKYEQNITYFFRKLKDSSWFANCQSDYAMDLKQTIVGNILNVDASRIILKSKHSFNKLKYLKK